MELPDQNAHGWLGLRKPGWVLFFLSPMIGELLSGSSPPAEFFQPFPLLVLAALYGSGAILIREVTLRWKKGWPTILLLGAAYGIIEEGLMVKSVFDPNWMDLGSLGTYGRWLGVNWIWSLELTVYHAIFSIAVPILLVELLFPRERVKPWVSTRALLGLGGLLGFDVILGFTLLTPYRPPPFPYVAAFCLVALLVLLAQKLPSTIRMGRPNRPKNAVWIGITAFVGTLGLFLISWIPPHTPLPASITFLLLAAWVGLILIILAKFLDLEKGSWRHQFALAAGGLGFFILIAPIQGFDTSRLDNPSGMMLVGMLFILFLFFMRHRAKRVEWDAMPA